MNPAKRKKLHRLGLSEKTENVPTVVEQKKPEPVVEKPVELPMALKELPKKEEPVVKVASVVAEQTVTTTSETVSETTTTKKKKV